MHRYRYRALVRLEPAAGPGGGLEAGKTCRVTVRAQHHQTHRSKFFSALADTPAAASPLDTGHSVQVTLTVLGDDVPDYLDAGDPVALWRGGDLGHGVITRRLQMWVEAP
ncbi:MAG: hypothetical protein ACRDNF_08840 [Streptosporangiaceae bacterium]